MAKSKDNDETKSNSKSEKSKSDNKDEKISDNEYQSRAAKYLNVKSIAIFAAITLAIIFIFSFTTINIGGNADPDEAEISVRDLVVIPEDENVRSIVLINSEEALSELKSSSPGILDEAKTGDYYIVFEKRSVLYRPDEDKVVYIMHIKS